MAQHYDEYKVSGVTVVTPKGEAMTQEGIQYRPIPPTYNGKAWSSKLLHQMSSAELRRVLSLYGYNQINNACAETRAAGGSQ